MPVIRAEVAKRHDELAAGLMGRKRLSENSGMLFIFGSKKPLSFWMASTYIPLQIAFIREDGIIGQIENMVPLSTKAVRSLEPCMYALEVNDGWFERNNVKVGAKVAVPFLGLGQELPPDQQGQQEPPMTIEQSYKDILKAVDSSGAKVLVEYLPKEGETPIVRAVEAPIVFGDTADGDVGGLATVWDSGVARYTSFIIDNILSIKDLKGNPIVASEQLSATAQAGKTRLTVEGKM